MKMEDMADEIMPPKRSRRERFGVWFNSDKQTTALACFLGALIYAKVDWAKVLRGDLDHIGLIIGAAVVVWQGYLTNRLPTIKP